MFSNKTFVQKCGLFGMDPLYLTLKITAMLRNKYLQLKTWIMGSKNVYMRDRFSGIAFDNSQVVGGGGKVNRGNGLRSLLPTIRILNYVK